MAEATHHTELALAEVERKATRRRAVGNGIRSSAMYTLLIFIAVLTIFPFLWMFSTSFKTSGSEMVWPPQWIPDPFTLENYPKLFSFGSAFPFARFIWNSVYISAVSVAGRVAFCALAGYAFARIPFSGQKPAFAFLILALLMPGMVLIIPLYQLYKTLSWLDTHMPLIVPNIFASTFGTFLFRQFFMTLPQELEDAARIDGAGYFMSFWRIALPLSKPVLAALAIFTFQGTWNAFESSRIFVLETRNQTLPVGLQIFNGRAEYAAKYGLLMAGATMAIIPVLIVYSFLQRYFVQGIALTGLKG